MGENRRIDGNADEGHTACGDDPVEEVQLEKGLHVGLKQVAHTEQDDARQDRPPSSVKVDQHSHQRRGAGIDDEEND